MELAIFRDVRQSEIDRLLRRCNLRPSTFNLDSATGWRGHTENCACDICASRADQSRHTQNFSFTEFKGDIFKYTDLR